MQLLIDIGLILLGYLLGSIPTGLIIVKLKTGKDIRTVESGRTGGTNALRAAGFWAGLATALLDVFKAVVAVWLAQWLSPAINWWRFWHPSPPSWAIIIPCICLNMTKTDASDVCAGGRAALPL